MNARKAAPVVAACLLTLLAGGWIVVAATDGAEDGDSQAAPESPKPDDKVPEGFQQTPGPGDLAGNSMDEKSTEPILRAPPTAQVPDEIAAQELPELPYLYRDAFLLVPVGTQKNNPTEYGDERDTWTYSVESTTSLDELPRDDLARIPNIPARYELAEVTWTAGTKPDGSFGGLINITFTYEARNLLPVTVSFGYPVKIADGRPYTMVVPGAPFQLRTVDVAGYPGVYEFPSPGLDVSGHQLLIVRDGELTVHVHTYRGVAYSDIVAIAESILIRTGE